MSKITQTDIDLAMLRSVEVWTNLSTHVECEQAFIDRLWLADEVKRLREQVAELAKDNVELERELYSASGEIEHLENVVQRYGE
jgi:hypothetical protein